MDSDSDVSNDYGSPGSPGTPPPPNDADDDSPPIKTDVTPPKKPAAAKTGDR